MLANMNPVGQAIIGGWKIAGISTYSTGAVLTFGKMNYDGSDPTISNPSMSKWFNTSAFSPIAANTFVIRSNPLLFDNLVGPSFYMLDATLSKNFRITEKVQAELKMAAYNSINRLNLGNPNTSITSSQFGQALYQGQPNATFGPQTGDAGAGVGGRQVELGMKIIF